MMGEAVALDQLASQIIQCRRCPRLVAWRERVAREKKPAFADQEYWGRPVPGFGDHQARLLVIGLAPAAHGANRTGRIFTGDRSGDWLYRAMHKAGFASQPSSEDVHDGMELTDAYVTAIVRCAPPGNRPTGEERASCRPWLRAELQALRRVRVILTLGEIAYTQALVALAMNGITMLRPRPPFRHGLQIDLGPTGPLVVASYHPSQQNTFTGRLTEAMLDDVFARVRAAIGSFDLSG